MKRKFPLISAALPSSHAQVSSVVLISLACAGFVHSADLLSWDVNGSTDVTGSGIATPLALGASGSVLTGVTIATTNDIEPGIDQVVVTIPTSLAVGSKLFSRLDVLVP